MKVYTIRLKNQFKDYNDFQTQLEPFLEDTSILDLRTFNIIMNMYGSAFLRYNTRERNSVNVAMVYERQYAIYIKQKQFYDLKLDELTTLQSEIENKVYSTNSTDLNNEVIDKFLNGKTVSVSKGVLPLLNQLEQIKKHIDNLVSPFHNFLAKLKNGIMLPIQPDTGDIETGGTYKNISKGEGYGF